MSAKKSITLLILGLSLLFILLAVNIAKANPPYLGLIGQSLGRDALADHLGWVSSTENHCGGYYLEQPFVYPVSVQKDNSIEITSNQTLFSQKTTSILEGSVTVNRHGQQLTANKAYLYRDPVTGKLSAMDVIGNVHLREPNSLIVARKGRYDFETSTKSLIDILYRTSISGREIVGPKVPAPEIAKERKVLGMTAWGRAHEFSQSEPQVYRLAHATYTTCPPVNPLWEVDASHIVLDKNAGRGYATNAKILLRKMLIFYIPYLNFPIDSRRKTGFLFPTIGGNNQWGPYVLAPFYWNLAPNYDMTITPGLLSKRGLQLSDNFRYLSQTSEGHVYFSVLPNDRAFETFQDNTNVDDVPVSPDQNITVTQAEVTRLKNASTTRKAFIWRDNSQYNTHWSSHVDFNYAGDDYYLENFGSNLNEISNNQLLQEGDLYYKGPNWNFIGRVQTYQTLHRIDSPLVLNAYRRLPQLILSADYPDQPLGLEYFIYNEATHFSFMKTPGTNLLLPVGDRLHTQPGVSLPLSWSYLYVLPRLQLALTEYSLSQTTDTETPRIKRRALPIFDLASGATLNRDTTLFSHAYSQTLEPQIYYTYIPYRNQASIPLFDTTENTLVYDQIFNYNRFTGLDRIGDANQVGVGVMTRLIDTQSGLEKVRLGAGEIFYFSHRRVTLCNSPGDNPANPDSCGDNPSNPANKQRLSPISGLLAYHINPIWEFQANPIWNPISKQLDNVTLNLHYFPSDQRIVNLGFYYARGGDPLSGIPPTDASNNLKTTDLSFAWPLIRDFTFLGRWSQNWNRAHLQNLLYGVEYDSCCVAVRFVAGRAYLGITNNNTPKYNSEFYLQFSLKGLGDVGRDPSGPLSTITGYKTQFGQEF